MTVKELIAALNAQDPNAVVVIPADYSEQESFCWMEVEAVESDDNEGIERHPTDLKRCAVRSNGTGKVVTIW